MMYTGVDVISNALFIHKMDLGIALTVPVSTTSQGWLVVMVC